MCKALDRGMVITDVKVLEKHGGKPGDWVAGQQDAAFPGSSFSQHLLGSSINRSCSNALLTVHMNPILSQKKVK
jgi:hypothetical protein